MKFTCTQENILRGLSNVTPIAGRNNQLPILKHVLLQAKDNVLHLTTTDLEIGIHTVIGGKMEEEGECVVPAKRLMEYVQQLPSSHPITIKQENNKIVVTTKGFKANFSVADVEEFPPLPTTDKDNRISLDAQKFCGGLSRVMFSASREDSRPEIQSVFLRAEEGELRLAATDSFRLAEEIIESDVSEEFSLLVPLSSAGEVVRLFGSQETMDIIPHENYITFYGEGIELTSRLVDGNYPDYKQIIPSSWKTKIILSKSELLRALKTLSVFLPKDSKRVHVTIDVENEKALFDVGGGEIGEGNVELSLEGEGSNLTTLFNVQYLLEGVQRIPGDECELKLGGEQEAALFSPVKQNVKFLYVVMPIQA